MTTRKYHIAVTLLVSLMIFQVMPAESAEPNSVQWHSYEEGMVLGKSEAKKVFINFYAKWCSYCRKMDTKTFTDKSVIDYIDANFIAVKVDVDKERHVAAQYNISPLPDLWFISKDGEAIGNKPGYLTAKDLLPVLKFIQTDSYLNMSYSQFLKEQ